jgi:hypothetical protein
LLNSLDAARPVPSWEPLRRRLRLQDVSRRALVTCLVIVALLGFGGVLLFRAVDPGETDATFIKPDSTPTPVPATSPGATPATSPGAELGRCPQAGDGRIGVEPFARTAPAHSPRPEPSPTAVRMLVCPAGT